MMVLDPFASSFSRLAFALFEILLEVINTSSSSKQDIKNSFNWVFGIILKLE